MIVVCHDCEGRWAGEAKQWRMPCRECREDFVTRHGAMGHHVTTRKERSSDVYLFFSS